MSKKQPFCDSSHVGSCFKPLKFSLDENVKEMHLCGCKLSSTAPFCDTETCKKLMAGESIMPPKDDEMDDENYYLGEEAEETEASSEQKKE